MHGGAQPGPIYYAAVAELLAAFFDGAVEELRRMDATPNRSTRPGPTSNHMLDPAMPIDPGLPLLAARSNSESQPIPQPLTYANRSTPTTTTSRSTTSRSTTRVNLRCYEWSALYRAEPPLVVSNTSATGMRQARMTVLLFTVLSLLPPHTS
jgi:hypothetical protein